LKVRPLATSPTKRVLDFDLETIAAGFADPDWVPQKITCAAWSWVGEDKVQSKVCGPLGLFGKPELRAEMLKPLLAAIEEADLVIGHNIERFDLPLVNAECMRLDLPPIKKIAVWDTMRLLRSKGFKKGQDNLGVLFKTENQKLPLNWQEWQDGYDEVGDNLDDLLGPNNDHLWYTIRQRAEIDVLQHKQIYSILKQRGYLKDWRYWKSK
jgi:DNA polymerase elongation subunit (family B)